MQTLQLMSGDYASLLPEFLQPMARKILGQEQKSGPAGFLQSLTGGGSGSSSKFDMMGGLGNLFGGQKE